SSVLSPFRRVEQPLFRHATSLVVRITLLPPWIPINVVAETFPKAGFVLVHQRNTPHPLGALPQIQMWDKKPCRSAVFRCKIFVVKTERDPRLPVPEVLQGQVSSVFTV